MARYIKINPDDNVAVALCELKAGEQICGTVLKEDIPAGHKIALADMKEERTL